MFLFVLPKFRFNVVQTFLEAEFILPVGKACAEHSDKQHPTSDEPRGFEVRGLVPCGAEAYACDEGVEDCCIQGLALEVFEFKGFIFDCGLKLDRFLF